MPRAATCSLTSKAITIVGGSAQRSAISPQSRQTAKPHNLVSTFPGEGQIGDRLRFQTDKRQATEVAIAADVLNRMLELGRPEYVRIACPGARVGLSAPAPPIHATRCRVAA